MSDRFNLAEAIERIEWSARENAYTMIPAGQSPGDTIEGCRAIRDSASSIIEDCYTPSNAEYYGLRGLTSLQAKRLHAHFDAEFDKILAAQSNAVAEPPRKAPRVARHKAASKHRVSSKPQGEMKPAQINAELDKLDALVSTLNDRMIADGRGYETSEQTWQASDPLALEWQAASQRRIDLLREIERRYQGGPSFRAPSRFPSGWRAGR